MEKLNFQPGEQTFNWKIQSTCVIVLVYYKLIDSEAQNFTQLCFTGMNVENDPYVFWSLKKSKNCPKTKVKNGFWTRKWPSIGTKMEMIENGKKKFVTKQDWRPDNLTLMEACSLYIDWTVLYIDARRRQSRGHIFSAIRYIRSTNICRRSWNLPSDLFGNSTMIECLVMGMCPNARMFVHNEMTFQKNKVEEICGHDENIPSCDMQPQTSLFQLVDFPEECWPESTSKVLFYILNINGSKLEKINNWKETLNVCLVLFSITEKC